MIRSNRRYIWIQLQQLQSYCLLQCLWLYLLLRSPRFVTRNSFKITLRSDQKNRQKFGGYMNTSNIIVLLIIIPILFSSLILSMVNHKIKITLRRKEKNPRKSEGIQCIPIGYISKDRLQYPAKIGHLYLIHFKCDNDSFLFILIYLYLFILCFVLFCRV